MTSAQLGLRRTRLRSANTTRRLTSADERIKPSLAEWLCECFDENCAQPVKLSMEEYQVVRAGATHFLVAPGEEHVSLSVEHVIRREEHYWIVEKIGVAAEMSEQSDPRSS